MEIQKLQSVLETMALVGVLVQPRLSRPTIAGGVLITMMINSSELWAFHLCRTGAVDLLSHQTTAIRRVTTPPRQHLGEVGQGTTVFSVI